MATQPLDAPTDEHLTVASLRAVVTVLSRAAGEPMWPLSGHDVEQTLELVGAARSVLDRLDVAAVREGLERGLHREQGYGAVDWVRACQARAGVPGDPAHASRVQRVAECAARPGAEQVWARFSSGGLSLGKADQIARFEREVSPVVASDEVEAVIGELVDAAGDSRESAGLTTRELATAIRYAGQLMKPEPDLEREHDARVRGRSLTKRPGSAGMCEYRLLLDPDASAIIDAAVAGLSAPVSGPDGEPDPRPAARRRADALIEVVRRGVSAPGEQPRSGKAQVVITMGLEQLLADLQGAGVTATGEVLSPSEVRRHACDASIIPMVLGSDGEVLDVGREQRLFTSGQRKALWRRDGGCTYPGCTIPPQWCDAHHVVWWTRGGPTDLSNGALLCGRHHTLVHRRDLSATVTALGVTWHTGLA
ncbi:HNH endonuclease signature motif containing protein [Luteipulveratus mongoliensis]|uniref:HNH endonuclease signature motif containing protein n=1 Tax=Luteipulveratus mongoliensis TaxID=571913 RepID=UPI0006961EA9|nr:HNH endonuclease signature motif containing protein [Luteipulveratus mongoliensis]